MGEPTEDASVICCASAPKPSSPNGEGAEAGGAHRKRGDSSFVSRPLTAFEPGLGGAGGYALSHWLIQDQKPGIAKLMKHINIAPLVVQNLKNEKPASGMQLMFAF